MFEAVFFYLFSLFAIVSGVGVVTMRNPIASALSLVICFFFLAADYALLGAHFVAVIQILVYAGAIMVLFIFVIMLLNLRHGDHLTFNDIGPRGVVGMATAACSQSDCSPRSGNFPRPSPPRWGPSTARSR